MLTQTTGKFTGYSRAAFPYILASKDDQMIYSTDCVPNDFRLSDPDHLKSCSIDALYSHWLGRQRKGLSPFIVLGAGPLHSVPEKMSKKAKGKQKVRYQSVHTSDDSGVENSDGRGLDTEGGGSGSETEEGPEVKKPPAPKIGPPKRKAFHREPTSQEAGPSNPTPIKDRSNKKPPPPMQREESPYLDSGPSQPTEAKDPKQGVGSDSKSTRKIGGVGSRVSLGKKKCPPDAGINFFNLRKRFRRRVRTVGRRRKVEIGSKMSQRARHCSSMGLLPAIVERGSWTRTRRWSVHLNLRRPRVERYLRSLEEISKQKNPVRLVISSNLAENTIH